MLQSLEPASVSTDNKNAQESIPARFKFCRLYSGLIALVVQAIAEHGQLQADRIGVLGQSPGDRSEACASWQQQQRGGSAGDDGSHEQQAPTTLQRR